MRKIALFFCSSLLIITSVFAQNNKSKFLNGITPYAEVAYAAGLCSADIPLIFIGGAQKPFGKHWSLGADVQYLKSDYEMYCCDVYSVGTYSTFIPSIKLNFDPGVRNKGFFIGAGLGYVVAHDRGTEQPYSYDPLTGEGSVGKEITNGNWDFNSIAPSFNIGLTFRIARIPFSYVNTNYFGITSDGFQPIAVGMGLRVNFRREPKR